MHRKHSTPNRSAEYVRDLERKLALATARAERAEALVVCMKKIAVLVQIARHGKTAARTLRPSQGLQQGIS